MKNPSQIIFNQDEMNHDAIQVENLSKRFILNHRNIKSVSFKEAFSGGFNFRFSGNKDALSKEEYWALKNINFTVNYGDKLGIIGRNGAGKSTLLKILSRIIEPTSGKITINGRIASLLEVGTGFHPELSGRENIFLNGAILGMTKEETRKNFDEIVNFSGVEKFLDTPVKRYSSGMYVRLAFAVAAFLNPEILIIDEVLAVGDADFQKKCLDKMKDISEKGKTILFVSHNMDAVQRLCNKSILIKNGEINFYGPTEEAVNAYLGSEYGSNAVKTWKDGNKFPGNEIVKLLEVKVHDTNFNIGARHDITKMIGITMIYEVLKDGDVFTQQFNLYNEQQVHILSSHDVVSETRKENRKKGVYASTMWIPPNLLAEGMFTISAAILKSNPVQVYFHEPGVVAFNVYDSIKGNSARGDFEQHYPGLIRPLLDWNTVYS